MEIIYGNYNVWGGLGHNGLPASGIGWVGHDGLLEVPHSGQGWERDRVRVHVGSRR
jgi:hypothetical protein